MLALTTGLLRSEPLPRTVRSWEGEFRIDAEAATIRIEQKAPLKLWLYRLNSGSAGAAVAFSDTGGKLLWAPKPANRGIQPIYREHFVTGDSEIAIVYDVQGNGGLKRVENFKYDGERVLLTSTWLYGGRHDPIWRKTD